MHISITVCINNDARKDELKKPFLGLDGRTG